jgi:dsDNA-specific endonuclease/ATPase MutS2
LDTEEELIRRRNNSLDALQELLSEAKNHRPSKADEISRIKKALKDLEDMKNYVKKFDDLGQLVDDFITTANNEPSNLPNDNWSARLSSIRNAIIEYRNAYANYAAHSGTN